MWVLITRLCPIAAIVFVLASCGGSRPVPTRSASSGADAPCVPAAIHLGAPPAWTAAAWSSSSPGFTTPYALASNGAAGAFFFARPLRAGHPSNPSNKVLWIVRFPRNGNPLLITARLSGDPTAVVRISRPADSSPGEIYPSYVDLPKAGCWQLSLAWGPHRARIDIQVERRA
jgi:hypothetical protein